MSDYVIKGSVKDLKGDHIKELKIQAMDSDRAFYEDQNDDMLGSVWVNGDGTFQISFDKEQFRENFLEGNPDIYLIVRNKIGEIIYTSEVMGGVKPSDTFSLRFDIILDSVEKKTEPSSDPYAHNMDRRVTSFARLGETAEISGDVRRIFTLLTSTLNAWALYNNEDMWRRIEYDGPQVDRYPWQDKHPHTLKWAKK